MSRIETAQGVLARRGFTDAGAAARILAEWEDDREYLLDLVGNAAAPDLALAALDRLDEVVQARRGDVEDVHQAPRIRSTAARSSPFSPITTSRVPRASPAPHGRSKWCDTRGPTA